MKKNNDINFLPEDYNTKTKIKTEKTEKNKNDNEKISKIQDKPEKKSKWL